MVIRNYEELVKLVSRGEVSIINTNGKEISLAGYDKYLTLEDVTNFINKHDGRVTIFYSRYNSGICVDLLMGDIIPLCKDIEHIRYVGLNNYSFSDLDNDIRLNNNRAIILFLEDYGILRKDNISVIKTIRNKYKNIIFVSPGQETPMYLNRVTYKRDSYVSSLPNDKHCILDKLYNYDTGVYNFITCLPFELYIEHIEYIHNISKEVINTLSKDNITTDEVVQNIKHLFLNNKELVSKFKLDKHVYDISLKDIYVLNTLLLLSKTFKANEINLINSNRFGTELANTLHKVDKELLTIILDILIEYKVIGYADTTRCRLGSHYSIVGYVFTYNRDNKEHCYNPFREDITGYISNITMAQPFSQVNYMPRVTHLCNY